MGVVICDTNVWYNIANGVVPPQDLQDKSLIGTFITAYELGSSFNIINDYAIVHKTVTLFNTGEVIAETPFEYMKKMSGLKFTENDGFWMFKNLEMIIDNHSINNIEAARQALTQLSDEENARNVPFMQLYSDLSASIDNLGEYKRKLKEQKRREQHLAVTEQLIQTLMPNEMIAWNNIELFVKTFDEWLFQLAINHSLKMTPNDVNDLLNLVYVQPEDKYWTFDRRKTKNFIHQCGCGHYLI